MDFFKGGMGTENDAIAQYEQRWDCGLLYVV